MPIPDPAAPGDASALPEPVFRKTKQGKWAVMGPVVTLEAALERDGVVQVRKKSGDHSTFTILSMGRAFDVDGVPMAYGYDDAGDGDSAASADGPGRPASRPTMPPPRDESEPLPVFQGDADDEWTDGF